MNYNGLDIDMFSLGDADSILVARWEHGTPQFVLIDGGNRQSARTVERFLSNQGIYYLDHVVCTHLHEDHAAGLVSLLSSPDIHVGTLWMHRPLQYVTLMGRAIGLWASHETRRFRDAREALDTSEHLIAAALERNITIQEPFAGMRIGPFLVCGPSREYYLELVKEFSEIDKILLSTGLVPSDGLGQAILDYLEESAGPDALLDCPETSPENNSSVILATIVNGHKYLFTGDAGAQALGLAAGQFNLSNCYWMQLPHHGSRRNLTAGLIQHFRPTYAFVSACGSGKHPRRAVVNALKNVGTRVYSTHYPSGMNLRQTDGTVPLRTAYVPAVPLWENSAAA